MGLGARFICSAHRENKHVNIFLRVGGEVTLLGQKTQSPGKASEIPGIHGKSQETSKNPGKFRDIFLVHIDKGEAILFLCSQTTATVLVLEG